MFQLKFIKIIRATPSPDTERLQKFLTPAMDPTIWTLESGNIFDHDCSRLTSADGIRLFHMLNVKKTTEITSKRPAKTSTAITPPSATDAPASKLQKKQVAPGSNYF